MDDSLRSDPCALAVRAAALAPGMGIPCDTIGRAVAGSLDAGDFTASSCTTYARVLEGMARALGPGRAVVELDAGELTGWFQHTRAAHGPATWNRDRVIVCAFVRHLQ
jgi:hypothetical protein